MAGYNGFQMDREFKWFNCLSAECPLSPSLSLALTYSCTHALKQAHTRAQLNEEVFLPLALSLHFFRLSPYSKPCLSSNCSCCKDFRS